MGGSVIADLMGEAKLAPLRVDFARWIKLKFHGARITADGGLPAYRELDDTLGFTDTALTKRLDGRVERRRDQSLHKEP